METTIMRALLISALLLGFAAPAARAAGTQADFDAAVTEAKHAEALARASIAQAKEQDTAWKALVIH